MPRSSRGSVRPSASHSGPSGSRQAHTASYPQQHAPAQHYPASQPVPQAGAVPQKQPGLMAQAASTMGGAVAGSVVGHGISSMLFGSSRPAEAAPPPPAEYAQQQSQVSQQGPAGVSCDIQAKDFTRCLEATNGDMTSCNYYLEALKACQAAAKPF